jgi:hypothetical protein
VAQRADGDAEGPCPSELTAERPCRLAIERPADDVVRPDDGVCGNEPPRSAVEIDLDAAARPLPQRRDDG